MFKTETTGQVKVRSRNRTWAIAAAVCPALAILYIWTRGPVLTIRLAVALSVIVLVGAASGVLLLLNSEALFVRLAVTALIVALAVFACLFVVVQSPPTPHRVPLRPPRLAAPR